MANLRDEKRSRNFVDRTAADDSKKRQAERLAKKMKEIEKTANDRMKNDPDFRARVKRDVKHREKKTPGIKDEWQKLNNKRVGEFWSGKFPRHTDKVSRRK